MASRNKAKQQVEDELRTLFVCTEVLKEQQAILAGKGEQFFKQLGDNPLEAQQHFERRVHVDHPSCFGPTAPDTSPQKAVESYIRALLWSNKHRTPGLSHLLQLAQRQQNSSGSAGSTGKSNEQEAAFSSRLLCLLRRVTLWYYYRVMFDPLDQLLALNSSYELLFQLMTPHQQLSCMADVLVTLACPALQDQGAQLDTPQHTATLLSMLKMAQQMALAEADLQKQQEQLVAIQQHIVAHGERDQEKASQQLRRLKELEQHCFDGACTSASFLTPPSLALLQLCRQQGAQAAAGTQQAPGQFGLWAPQFRPVTDTFRKRFGFLLTAVTQQQQFGRIDMLGSYQMCKVAQQQSAACQAVGALLSQLSGLSEHHLLLLWYSLEPDQQVLETPSHATIAALLLQQCCSALQGCCQVQLPVGQAWESDPLASLVSWVADLIGQGTAQHSCQSQQQQQQQGHRPDCQHAASSQQQQHPAEALRQVLAVLLSALQYRHTVIMQEWQLQQPHKGSQAALLTALHSHCMQLLAQARDQIPAEACTLGQQPHGNNSSSSSSGLSNRGGSSSGSSGLSNTSGSSAHAAAQLELQQHAREWRRVLGRVQQELLAVVKLKGHWRHHNAFSSFESLLALSGVDKRFVSNFLSPLPRMRRSSRAAAAADAVLAAAMQWLRSQPRAALPPQLLARLHQGPARPKQQAGINSRQQSQPATAAAAHGKAGPSVVPAAAAAAAVGAVPQDPALSQGASSSSSSSSSKSQAPQQRSQPRPMMAAAQHVIANMKGIHEQVRAYLEEKEELPIPVASLCVALELRPFELHETLTLVHYMIAVVTGIVSGRRAAVESMLLQHMLAAFAKGTPEGRLQRTLEVLLERVGLQAGELPGVSRWWQSTLQRASTLFTAQQQAQEQQQQQHPRRYPGTGTAAAPAVASTAAAAAAAGLLEAAAAAAGDQGSGSSSEDGESSSAASVLRIRGGGDGSGLGSEAEALDSDTAVDQHEQQAGDAEQSYEPAGFDLSSSSTAALPAQVPDTDSISSGEGSSSSEVWNLYADPEKGITKEGILAAAAAGDVEWLRMCVRRLWTAIVELYESGSAPEGACQLIAEAHADTKALWDKFEKQRNLELAAQACCVTLQLNDELLSGSLQDWQGPEGMAEGHAAAASGSAADSLAGSDCEDTARQHVRSSAGQQSEGGSSSGSGSGSGSQGQRTQQGHRTSSDFTDAAVEYFVAAFSDEDPAATGSSQDPAEEFSAQFSILQDFWDHWLRHGHAFVLSVQEHLLQQQHGETAGLLRAARMFSSSVRGDATAEHFRGMPFTHAVAWLELVVYLRDLDSSVADRFLYLQQVMVPLLHLLSSAPGGYDRSDGFAGRECLALATLLLQCGSLLEGPYRAMGADDYNTWSTAHDALVALLDVCYNQVTLWAENRSLRVLAGEARSLSTRRRDLIPKKLAATMSDIKQDLSGVAAAVDVLQEVLRAYIKDLGPVEVKLGSLEEFQADTIISSHTALFDWASSFADFIRLLEHVVRTHAWLACTGRQLQGEAKSLRRARRALLLGLNDPYIARLFPKVEAATKQVMNALTEVVSAHSALRERMQSGLVTGVWGVIQHAFNLVNQKYDENDSSIRASREDLLHHLHCVLCSMMLHVASSSCYVPEFQLPKKSTKRLAGSLGSLTTQQLIFMFSRMTDPEASLWFLLPEIPGDTEFRVERRARGLDTPVWAARFKPSSDSSSGSPQDVGPSRHRVRDYFAAFNDMYLSDYSQKYDPLDDDVATYDVTDAVYRAKHRASVVQALGEQLAETQAELDLLEEQGGGPQLQRSLLAKRRNLQHELRQREVEQKDAQHMCLARVQRQPAMSAPWQRDLSASLSLAPPCNSTYSCSSSTDSTSDSSSDSDSDDTDPQHPPGLQGEVLRLKQRQAAAAGANDGADASVERRLQRRRRRVAKDAPFYDWGARPWHVQRARLLHMRQLRLNRAAGLQIAAHSAVVNVRDLVATLRAAGGLQAPDAAGATQAAAGRQMQQTELPGLHISCQPAWLSLLEQRAGSTDELRSADLAAAAAAAAAAMPDDVLAIMWYVCGSHRELPAEPSAPGRSNRPDERLLGLQQLAGEIKAVHTNKRDVASELLAKARSLQQCQKHLQELCGAESPLLGEAVFSCLPHVQQRQRRGVSKASSSSGSSIRTLLWELLGQTKPAACSWYKLAVEQHYVREQVKRLEQCGILGNADAALIAALAAETRAQSAAVQVSESSNAQLWSTLTASLASDLLLVPPSIRDFVGNDWAAGAGRLQEPGSSSSSSSGSTAAARMLVVQYARASRRQYSQTYQASGLLWQLLAVQLMAADYDMLTELQGHSASDVKDSLAAHTDAAVSGMLPAFVAAAQLGGVHLKHTSSSKSSSSPEAHPNGSSSSGGSSSGVTERRGSNGSASNSSSNGRHAEAAGGPDSVPQLSLLHMTAQLGCCLPAAPQDALPWLQLLSRYHALSAGVAAQHTAAVNSTRGADWQHRDDSSSSSSDDEEFRDFDPSLQPQGRLAAMAVALQSCAVPLPPAAALLCRAVQERYKDLENVPALAAPLSSCCTNPVSSSSSARGLGGLQQQARAQQQQQQQQLQEPQQQWVERAGFWVHVDRLMQVQPGQWQQHLAQHLATTPQHASHSNGVQQSQTGDKPNQQQIDLLCDLACDWCCSALPSKAGQAAKPATGSSSSSSKKWGCPSCGAAQYCSQKCADAAKSVHNANCWRLQSLAADGVCWRQPQYQQASNSNRSRSFWDLRAVE